MATFVASQAVNMTTGLAILDSDVTLEQLMQVSLSGAHQYWNVGSAGLAVDLSPPVIVGDEFSGSFSTSFTGFALHADPNNEVSQQLWRVTGDLMSVNGSYTTDNFDTYFNLLMDIPGMWHGEISLGLPLYETRYFDQSLTGTYQNFAQMVLRGADTVTGSTGNDNLLGYAGNDAMNGGLGNDTMDGGVGNDIVKGGGGADVLKGLGGADRLYGGAGNDKLTGGVGADKFYFDTALTSNKDTILDFSHALGDKIVLDMTIFKKFLAPATTLGAHLDIVDDLVARDGNDWIIYNPTSGALFYDKDGSGTTFAPAPFAVLGTATHPATLVTADFQVVL